MTVYVGRLVMKFSGRNQGRVMCRIVADSQKELFAVTDALGIARRRAQMRGTSNEHFDLDEAQREKALDMDAFEVSDAEIATLMRHKRDMDRAWRSANPR